MIRRLDLLVLVHVFDGKNEYREYAEEKHQGNHCENYQCNFDSFALAFALGVYLFHIVAYVSTSICDVTALAQLCHRSDTLVFYS